MNENQLNAHMQRVQMEAVRKQQLQQSIMQRMEMMVCHIYANLIRDLPDTDRQELFDRATEEVKTLFTMLGYYNENKKADTTEEIPTSP